MPNNDPGAEMGCTTPGAVGAGAMGQQRAVDPVAELEPVLLDLAEG